MRTESTFLRIACKNEVGIILRFVGIPLRIGGARSPEYSILYGSYARGDYSEFSDIDVMLLVSLTADQIKEISDQISDLAFDYMMKYGADISPVITNTDHFNYWVDNLPYYRNIRDEGVRLSA